ncbi:AAA family ATPase [Candidatus Saccharibacteria bacterium]|nr:AAA family ATPase [Candidatus Saccharibacteria bacterium]
MNEPLLHSKTKLLIDSYLEMMPHSLLLVAPKGSGKLYRAMWLAEQAQLTPIHVSVLEDKKMIGIEQIQHLYTQTRSGSPTMVIIEGAEQMSTDAQNALLKLLEEPPENTHFALTANDTEGVLPTIRSRCQVITLIPPAIADLKSYALEESDDLDNSELSALVATTQGQIGALMSILSDTNANEAHSALVKEAKQFYGSSAYDRLKIAGSHNLDRDWALQLLGLLSVIISALISSGSSDPTRARRLQRQVDEIERATTTLKQAGNPKIHISRLALAL